MVESLNARPLSWNLEKKGDHDLIYSSPKVLSEMLLDGQLDTALISSVEVLRNGDRLGYSRYCGVSSKNRVRSILFFQNLREPAPPPKIYVDSGSRTSVALLELLVEMEFAFKTRTISTPPQIIAQSIQKGKGSHLLFGDNALFLENYPLSTFRVVDLAEWWYRLTNLYFIFALWAFPAEKPIKDEFFQAAMDISESGIEEITNHAIQRGFNLDRPTIKTYLTRDLHFLPEEETWKGFRLFEKLLWEKGILH